MRNFLLSTTIFVLALFGTTATAQNIADYEFEASIEAYQEINGGQVISNNNNLNNQFFNNNDIGFDFSYGSSAFNKFGISSNGYIVLGTINNTNSNLPIASLNNSISPLGSNLNSKNGSEIRTELTGTSPDRIRIIQWKNFRHSSRNGNLNFQIKLYERSGKIEFSYGVNSINYNGFGDLFALGYDSQVGLRGNTASDYNARQLNWEIFQGQNWNTNNLEIADNINSVVDLWFNSVPETNLNLTFSKNESDLGLNVFPNVAELCANQEFIYSIEVSNASGKANSNISVEFEIPTGTSFVSANTSNGIYDQSTGLYTINDLAENETSVLEVIVNVNVGMEGSNINADAEIVGADVPDPDLSNNSSSVNLSVGNNSSPQLSDVNDQTAPYNGVSAPIDFTVSDAETAADDLIISVNSSNQTLLPNGNITINGSGENRELVLQPALNQFGTTTITIELSDGTCPIIKTFEVEVFRQIFNSFEAAKIVVGQPNFTSGDDTDAGDASQIIAPGSNSSAVSVKGVLAVGSQTTNRVLIWNSVPTNNGVPADIVVGQNNFTNTGAGDSRRRLNSPNGVTFSPDGNKLIIADSENNRVLIFNSIPTTNNAQADVVVGQADFNSNNNPRGGRNGLNNPSDVQVTPSGKMIVTDRNSSRVLIYNRIPIDNNADADVVIGQDDFTSYGQATADDRLRIPWSTSISPDGKLLIADDENHRVLVFNSIPTTNGAAADVVIGQENFNSGNAGLGADRFSFPGVTVSPSGVVAVADFSNNRALIFNEIPTTNGVDADVVLGQRDFDENVSFNDGNGGEGNPSDRNMATPYGINFDLNERLYINGRDMNRMMIFGETPSQISDLSIAFTSDSNTPCVNTVATYEVSVYNDGPNNATNVVVTSALPSGFTPTESDPQKGTYNQESGFWRIPLIENGETVTLKMTGTVNVGENNNLITAYASVRSYNQNDSDFSNNSGSVEVTILDNEAPTMNEFDDVILDINTASPNIDFTVNDANVDENTLTVVASSSDQSLVKDDNITLGGGGANRFLQITPESGQFGLVTISVTVDDGTCSTTQTFELFVGNIWLGNTTVWNAANNWSAGVPTDMISAVIPNNPLGGNFPVINGAADVNNLIINENAQITVNAGRNLNVFGNLTNLGSEYTGNGSVSMVGNTTQWLMGRINGLIINNGNGVNLENDLSTNRPINIQSGQLVVGDNSLTIRNPISGNPQNLIMDGTSSLIVRGTAAGISIPSNITVLEDLQLENGSGLSLNNSLQINDSLKLYTGTFAIGNNNLDLLGFTHTTNGGFSSNNGAALSINSTGNAGKIVYSTVENELSDLSINVTSGSFEIENSVVINNQLELINGKLISSNGFVQVTNTAQNGILINDNAYIFGTLRRCVDTGIDYELPIGSNDFKQSVDINFNSMSENTCIDVFFTESNSDPLFADISDLDLEINGNAIEQLLDYGFWTINPTNTSGTYHYNLSVTSQGHVNGNESGNHILLKREDGSSNWEVLGDYSANNESGSFTDPITVSRSNLSGFSDFAVGASSQGPLPVELLSFEAEQKQSSVLLKWSTASEKNNSHFEVQKSANGKDFETIGMVEGYGNSSSLIKYDYHDYSSHGNVSYYRLHQFDFDGESEYSPVIKVEFETRLFNIRLFPNPATHQITINFDQEVGSTSIQIVNVNGQTVMKENLDGGKSVQLDISDLATGYYQVIVWSQTEKGMVSSNSKLLKK